MDSFKMKSPKLKLLLFSIAVIICMLAGWLYQKGGESSEQLGSKQFPEVGKSNTQSTPSGFEFLSRTATTTTTQLQSTVHVPEQRIEASTALIALLRWIKQRDGKDVKVVHSQVLEDVTGVPTSINVLVTARSNGDVSIDNVKRLLGEVAAQEQPLKEELRQAYDSGDVDTVNRLVANLKENRMAMVVTNDFASYKVSLSKERPPVLSFWSGLPIEIVREEESRAVAEKHIGKSSDLHGMVHYTSATALLCFTNGSGGKIYIDPIRLAVVPIHALGRAHSRTTADGGGRELRINAQWADFLAP